MPRQRAYIRTKNCQEHNGRLIFANIRRRKGCAKTEAIPEAHTRLERVTWYPLFRLVFRAPNDW